MYHHTARPLTFEALLCDPLTRLVMDADGVTVADLVSVLRVARDAVDCRERKPAARAVAWLAASATGAHCRQALPSPWPALCQSATT